MKGKGNNHFAGTQTERPSTRIISDALEHMREDPTSFDINTYANLYDATDRESEEGFIEDFSYALLLEDLFLDYRKTSVNHFRTHD
jgi:hypothetical protein